LRATAAQSLRAAGNRCPYNLAPVAYRKSRVLLVRGHQAAPWNLRMWEQLPPRFEVAYLLTQQNMFDVGELPLERIEARTLRGFLPPGRLGELATGLTGDRYLGIDGELARADLVHAEELSYWFAADPARRKPQHKYKLVLTVWETLPLLDAFRNKHAKVYRQETLEAADLFLAVTERARAALLLEGVAEDRIEVWHPGIDLARFAEASRPEPPPAEHVLISPGRLVWEKGHQDVMRALAALRSGLVDAAAESRPRLLVVGDGPERERLRQYAQELGIADAVEFRSVPYEEMPQLYARASCMVLASLSSAGCARYLGDLPRCFWEEQFGLVLAEAMAAGLPIVASASGAIPEVVGEGASLFQPGDWLGLAQRLAEGPLARPAAERVSHEAERLHRFSTDAAGERLAAVYDRMLSASS
jgi:glycosyltransferase involved in cell wall biosynthesis